MGLFFHERKQFKIAQEQFEKALTKEITTLPERNKTEEYLKKTKKRVR